MRAFNLAVFTSSLVLLALLVSLAPEFFESGGWLHHAALHLGTAFGSVTAFVAARRLTSG